MIRVSHLTKRYGSHEAVSDLNFHIEKGVIYGFLGPNGAGKTTTMNMVTGCLAPTEGDVTICGVDIRKNPAQAKKHIGYLPEIPPVYMDMTPREYLKFVLDARGVPRKEWADRLSRVMEKTDLVPMQNRLIRHLSKGYRQRVGVAQALIGDPEIIILDEPTVGLDPAQMIGIRELIRELGKDHTVILSSHILSEVQSVCDRVLIVAGGKLLAQGSTEELSHVLGGMQMELLAKAGTEQVQALLGTLEGITALRCTEDEAGCTSAVFSTKEDVREKVFRLFAENDITLLEMHTRVPSLEDVFLRITGEGNET